MKPSRQDIEGLDRLTERYRQDPGRLTIQPPESLDRRLRAQAREASAVDSRSHRPRFRLPWTAPLALAATLVLGVGLVSVLQQQPSTAPQAVTPLPSAPAPASQAEAPAAADSAPAPEVRRLAEPDEASLGRQSPDPAAFSRAPPPVKAQAPSPEPPPARSGITASVRQEAPGSGFGVEPDPQEWLERIRELQRQGRQAEAAERLAAFRERFADYPIPEDLRSR